MNPSIAAPPNRVVTRIVVPVTLVGLAALALAWTGWRTIVPAPVVEVVPVSVRAAGHGAGRSVPGGTGETRMEVAGPPPASPDATPAPRAEGAPVQAPGWVEPSPFPVMVPALTPGVVRSVLALEGDRVEAGQVLVELVDDEQRIALRRAEADLAESRAKVAEMEDELGRKSRLVETGAASAGEVARLRLRIDAMRAAAGAAESETAMRALAVERTKVRAPVAGVVMARNAVPGMPAGGMQDAAPLVVLYDPAELQVRADVPLADAGRIAVGDRAEVTLDVLPGRTFRGEVVRMVHQADIAKNTVQAKVRIADPAAALKPDMLARVKLFPRDGGAAGGGAGAGPPAGAPRKTAIWVPEPCLVAAADGDAVLAVTGVEDGLGTLERRVVQVGERSAGWAEVREGLRAGDLLARDPGSAPAPGTRVRASDSWRSAAEGGDHVGH
jgi:membrane fusion protein (multidrug efflux system)